MRRSEEVVDDVHRRDSTLAVLECVQSGHQTMMMIMMMMMMMMMMTAVFECVDELTSMVDVSQRFTNLAHQHVREVVLALTVFTW